MSGSATLTALLGALVVCLVVTPVVVLAIRRVGLVDVPNQRSLHSLVVPRGGGLAVAFAAGGVALALTWWDAGVVAVVVGAAVLGVVGLLDDRSGLPALPRLGTQVVVPLVGALVVADRTGWALAAAVLVSVVWCAGYVNAFNFMDGINGISASQAAVAAAFLALVGRHLGDEPVEVASMAMVGAAVGFLPYNAVRPRVFLGDVGSYFIGFWLSASALLLWDAGAPPLVLLAPFALYLADTSVVLLRRWRRGAPLLEAHREHAYQRLVQLGWSHVAVASLCCLVSIVNCTIMYFTVDSSAAVQAVALVAVVALVAGYLALPSLLGRSSEAAT